MVRLFSTHPLNVLFKFHFSSEQSHVSFLFIRQSHEPLLISSLIWSNFLHVCTRQHKHSEQTQTCLIFLYIKKEIDYFISTSTYLSIYTSTEAIEPHCNFRGTKTGNFSLFQVACWSFLFKNRMFRFHP